MIYDEKQIILKNGMVCILRSPARSDAEAMLCYLKQTCAETEYLTRYPDELTMTAAEEAEFLAGYLADLKNMMLCTEVEGRIIGGVGLNCVMNVSKCRHRATFGIAVQKEYWNLGIGTVLLTELIEFAAKAGYEQLELEVDCRNERAIKLYKKHGFEIYGKREHSFKQKEGMYSACYLMMRPLGM